MDRRQAIFHLAMIAKEFQNSHLDTECEAIQVALYDMGIVEHLQKERDALLEEVKSLKQKIKISMC